MSEADDLEQAELAGAKLSWELGRDGSGCDCSPTFEHRHEQGVFIVHADDCPVVTGR